MEEHETADQLYLHEGIRILELARKAVSLYERQPFEEKRRLLRFVFSNSTWKDGQLHAEYRKPFDMLAVTNAEQREAVGAGTPKSAVSDNWLPGQDSNLE